MITDKQFENLFRSSFANMCNFAYTIVKDSDLARDVVQQSFVNLWDKRSSIDINVNISSYLHRTIVNVALNHIEKNKRITLEDEYTQAQMNSMVQSDSSDYLTGELEGAVKKAVEQLPDKCQTVFSLSRFQGMSNQDIADSLDISIKAVEKHISKAIKELRVSLKPYLNTIEFFLIFEVGLWLAKLLL